MVLSRATTADETLNATVLSRFKNLQATNPALDYGTLEVLTWLTEEEVRELFPPEDEAPQGYYEIKHPETFVSHEMSITHDSLGL